MRFGAATSPTGATPTPREDALRRPTALGQRALRITSMSARLADRVDELPLPHPRAAGDVFLAGQLIELLAVAIIERVPGLASSSTALARLLLQPAPGALGQVRQGALALGGRLGLLDVLLGDPGLLGRRHDTSVLLTLLGVYPMWAD